LRTALTCLIIFFIFRSPATAQVIDGDPVMDSIVTKLDRYGTARTQPEVYLHIDKTLYVPNENIWFTGYVLQQKAAASPHTLYVALIEEASRKVVSAQRFVIDNFIAKGYVFIPDSLLAGEYRILGYTNLYPANPQQSLFQQQVSIRRAEEQPFTLSMLPFNQASIVSDSVKFMYKVGTSYGGLASDALFTYELLANGETIQAGKKKVNAFGEVELAVSKNSIVGKRIELASTIEKQKQKQLFKTTVPLLEKTILVQFYPEGGNLVSHHTTKMAFTMTNGASQPFAFNGDLYANGERVNMINADAYGTGTVDFTPVAGKSYTLKGKDTGLQFVYTFPVIAERGYALSIEHPVISDTSFAVNLHAPAEGSYLYVMVHNYATCFSVAKLLLKKAQGRVVLSAQKLPPGIATVTLFNEAGVPQAERAVYIKRGGVQVAMTTDSATYHHRSKVQLNIKMTDEEGKPVQSIFSLATVLATRVDSLRYTDITRFANFDRFLPAASAMPTAGYLTEDQHIETILLTKYWTRYKTEFGQGIPQFTANDLPCYDGQVFYRRKRVKAPVKMMISNKQGLFNFATDSIGRFSISSKDLPAEPGKKVMVVVAEQNNFEDYSLEIKNAAEGITSRLSQYPFSPMVYQKSELSKEEKGHLKASTLGAVVVTAKRNNFVNGVFKSTTCADWVCMYNVLNCPNHPFGSKPVDGASYNYQGRGMVTYVGCVKDTLAPRPFIRLVDGTYFEKEFYKADYAKFNPQEPEIMTTVFWSYETATDANGMASIEFYTNDLNGRFTCFLQGISTKGVVSGRYSYKVVDEHQP
jgi:hypothetical protein